MTEPLVHREAAAFAAWANRVRAEGGTLGFVPTMGALHAGHLALVDLAREHATHVAVSVFVNPTQFGPKEDLSRYPRPFERDLALCAERGVHAVFAPGVSEMYPAGERTRVSVSELGDGLCGASRPGHFDGVATIVTKLFVLSGPCVAVFGRKDYQQLKIVERLTRDLLLPVQILSCPIVRDVDGLALSSRNQYLSAEERARALAIPRALEEAGGSFRAGTEPRSVERAVEQRLTEAGLRVDYVSIVDGERLTPLPAGASSGVLAVAAFSGSTRLIDNEELEVELERGGARA